MKNMRVMISLDVDDVEDLQKAIHSANATSNSHEWWNRLNRIREHMTDDVPIHYTDLGTNA